MKQSPVVFLFNSPLTSGCDYVLQTIQIVSQTNPVYGLALGDIISLPQLLRFQGTPIVRRVHGAIIIRPISIFPGLRFRVIRMLSYLVFVIALRIYVDCRHRSRNTFLWFFEPFHIPSLLSVFLGYRTVYDCVDYYPGFHRRAKSEHDQLMQKSTYVFANSKVLANLFQSIRPDIVTVPLGFATELFGDMKIFSVRQKKRVFTVGYIGSISNRLDFELLRRIINQLPEIQFVFIGVLEPNVFGVNDRSEEMFRLLCQNRNVRWVSGVVKQQIPAVLRQCDLGIIPYRTDLSFNQYAFPMKVMEYFASGRPVVSTDIFSLRQYAQIGLLTLADSPEEFVSGIRHYMQHGWNATSQKRQLAEAVRNSWTLKVDSIMKVLYKNLY